MIVYLLVQKILSLFLIVIAGAVVVRLGFFKSEESKVLSKLCVYFLMPCSIIMSFQVDFTEDLVAGLLLSFGAAVLVHIILLIALPIIKRVFRLDTVEGISVIYSNAGNLIIPLVSSILGDEWVIYVCGFLCVQNFLLWSHGKSTLSGSSGIEWKKVFHNANMVCIVLGILMFVLHIRITGPVQIAASSLAQMVGPCSMIVTGFLLGSMDLKKLITDLRIWKTAALRLLLIPAITVPLLKLLAAVVPVANADRILLITLMATLTPSASLVTQMSQLYCNGGEKAGAINAMTTICCVITMPVMIALYQM